MQVLVLVTEANRSEFYKVAAALRPHSQNRLPSALTSQKNEKAHYIFYSRLSI